MHFYFKNLKINIFIKETPFNAPHTEGQNIFVPPGKLTEKVLRHEIIHIYFRYFRSPVLERFCREMKIRKINREKFPEEIDNPDTNYFIALETPFGLITPAITSPGSANFYTWDSSWRPSTREEKDFYNKKLPFHQNYHPEEILAEIYASDY